MTVRLATSLDKHGIVRLLRDAHAAAPAMPVSFSAPHAANLVDRHLTEANLLALVWAPQGCPQGVLLASAQDHPFGPIRYAAETVWWIDPGARGRGATDMLAAYEEWAMAQSCAFVSMAALASFPAAGRLYARRGYAPVETHFSKPLTRG